MGLHLCIECGTSCSSVRAFKKHKKDVHSQINTTCSQCEKTFKNHKQMENHLASHQTIVCIGCNVEIPKNSKSSHLCGENQSNFKCDQCDYVAKQKGALQRHLKVHSKDPKEKQVFSCHVCPKTFQRKDNMRTHIQLIQR